MDLYGQESLGTFGTGAVIIGVVAYNASSFLEDGGPGVDQAVVALVTEGPAGAKDGVAGGEIGTTRLLLGLVLIPALAQRWCDPQAPLNDLPKKGRRCDCRTEAVQ